MKKAIVVALLASGCVATHPDSIKPVPAAAAQFDAMDCSALASADQQAANSLFRLETEQKNTRTGDMIGIVAVGVSTTGMGVPTNATDIGRLKGEREAIATAKASKGCTEPPATVDEMAMRRQMTKERIARENAAKSG